jgi:hypothetical protein
VDKGFRELKAEVLELARRQPNPEVDQHKLRKAIF